MKLLNLINQEALKTFRTQDDAIKSGINLFARGRLFLLERKALAEGVAKEEILKLRPDKKKKEDYVDKLLPVILMGMKLILEDAKFQFNTDSNGTITDFVYEYKDKSKTGG